MSDFQVGAPRRGKQTSSADAGGQAVSTQTPEQAQMVQSTMADERTRRAAVTRANRAESDAVEARQAAQEKRAQDRAAARASAATPATPVAPAGTPAAPTTPAPVAPAPAPVPASTPGITSTTGAGQQMTGYDAYTQQALGKSPAEAMQMAQAAAAQQAQMQSDAAIRQAAKGARTAGAMPGQAALAATGIASDAYGQGQAAGQQQYFDLSKLGASLGSEMSSRLARGEQIQAGKDIAKMSADASAKAARAQANQGLLGNVIGAVGGIASLFSDERLKEDIQPDRLTAGLDALRGYSYKYKGQERPEAGVMAQDLEKTNMAPAVVDTPEGKMVDTRRLSTMNTAGLAEHEKRLKDIERLVKALGAVPGPKKE